MQSDITDRFAAIEDQRAALQSRVLGLSDAQRDWMPRAGAWSLRQIVEHLVLSDETVGQARDPASMTPEPLLFRLVPRAVRRALILHALRRDVALPLPSPAVEPSGTVLLPELLKRWAAMRGEMQRVLETRPADERRYAHPVLGALDAAQMLALAQTHLAYHARQMDRLQRDRAFPA